MKRFALIAVLAFTLANVGGCSAAREVTIDDVERLRDRFERAIEKARGRPCTPPYLERAYYELQTAVFDLDSLEVLDEFIAHETQEYDAWRAICP